MSPGTLARLAVAGNRTDVLRLVLTAGSTGVATVALLAAATVISVQGYADRYTSALLAEPGLRPGVSIALVLVSLPVLALAGQCIRLGAPARDRRLAAMRLAGATPGESVLIATAETAVAGFVGSSTGLVAYALGRQLIAARDHFGRLRLPTDVLPPIPVIVLVVLAIPLLAAVIGAVLMRRVIVTPLGVVRRTRSRGPRPWPGLLIAVGLVLFGLPLNWPDGWHRPDWHLPARLSYGVLGLGVVLVMAGVVLGTGWISHTVGRLLRRYGRMPSTLLAGQRLITDPWHGSRTLAALLVAVVAGGATLGFREALATDIRAQRSGGSGLGAEPEFYFNAYRLVLIVVGLSAVVAAAGMLVALAESIVAGRRSYAALTASGVPRRTLAASVLWQTLTPLVPALLLAVGSGVALARLFDTHPPAPVPVPFQSLGLLGAGALLAVVLAAGAGLLVLRSSTDLEELRV
ncbi:permease [Actinoplanes sp. TBRC 11911]|uniref:FtsX-like permease family protein n=1 Tax=Actinoplanes sp. TBRC 11911 TaxID=2729386 RepID=UPI00145CFAFE|nr:FtsX-like permease family protein [Actinoplanes sp. TBRC 11911]NMO54326.1 permease [Actinoplanes sp. TBRC 11911]